MDVQLKELIEKIKTEGVKTAEEQSAEIIREAEKKAAALISKAESDSAALLEKRKDEAARFEASGKEALKQAGRDLILATRKHLETLYGKILEEETAAVLKGDFLETSITSLVRNWKDDISDMSVLLPENQIAELEKGIRAKISDSLKNGLELKPIQGIKSGFRLSKKDGSVYYDFTSHGIAEILSELLNPRIAELLREAAAGEA